MKGIRHKHTYAWVIHNIYFHRLEMLLDVYHNASFMCLEAHLFLGFLHARGCLSVEDDGYHPYRVCYLEELPHVRQKVRHLHQSINYYYSRRLRRIRQCLVNSLHFLSLKGLQWVIDLRWKREASVPSLLATLIKITLTPLPWCRRLNSWSIPVSDCFVQVYSTSR